MSEASIRRTLGMAVIAAVIGVVALALGAFVAPIPQQTDARQLVTALFVRGILALLALVGAFIIAYLNGYRIEASADEAEQSTPQQRPDPSASSLIVSLFTTPGSRRDAMFGGGLVLGVYWLMTTLYIVALGKIVGNVGVSSSNAVSFLFTHFLQGLAIAAAGAGAGGFGSRNAQARRVTQRFLTSSSRVEAPLQTAPDVSEKSEQAPE